MTTPWSRARAEERCGNCGLVIPPGAPMKEHRFAGVSRRLLRCATCVGEPVPEDLPALPERCDHKFVDSNACAKCGWTPPAFMAPVPVQPLGGLPLDWKSRQAEGEREPGEEG